MCVSPRLSNSKELKHHPTDTDDYTEERLNRPVCAGRVPDEPQSQQMSFPGSRWTSSMMALVRSSRLFSPVLCSPRKAMLRASSLLFVSTDIHLWSRYQRKGAFVRAWPPLSSSTGNLPSRGTSNSPRFSQEIPPPKGNKVRKNEKVNWKRWLELFEHM